MRALLKDSRLTKQYHDTSSGHSSITKSLHKFTISVSGFFRSRTRYVKEPSCGHRCSIHSLTIKVKVSFYRPRRPTGDVNARVHIYTAKALGRSRLSSPALGRLYPPEKASFYKKLSGPRDQFEHGVKENLYPFDARDRTRAVEPIVKHLVA